MFLVIARIFFIMVHISKYPCLRICLFGNGLNIPPFIFSHLCDGVCFQGSWKVTVGGIKHVLLEGWWALRRALVASTGRWYVNDESPDSTPKTNTTLYVN